MSSVRKFDVASILLHVKEKKPDAANNYEMLRSLLEKPRDLPTGVLTGYLRDLRKNVVDLSKEHELLVGVVIKIDWTTRGPELAKEYHSFIISLVTMHSVYLSSCLKVAVDQFSLHTKTKDVDKRLKPGVPVVYEPTTWRTNKDTFSYLHNLLRAIVQMSPRSAQEVLPSLLHDYFPFTKDDGYVVECYVQNLLSMTTYAVSIRCKILRLIFVKLMVIDLHAPPEDVLREEREGGGELLMDEDLISSTSAGGVIIDVPRSSVRHNKGRMLDNMMYLLFSYVDQVCHISPSNQLNWEATRALYEDLRQVFDMILLPTQDSNYLQFVLFYICSFQTSLAERFLDYLWMKATDTSVGLVYRSASTVYISEFLAHAKYIPISIVRSYLYRMCDWIHIYINKPRLDSQYHGPFYAVCQAVFNVFVSQHCALLKSDDDVKFCKSLNLPTIVNCHLNPLHNCAPSIADKFASVARTKQIVFCDMRLQGNRRRLLPEAGVGGEVLNEHRSNCLTNEFRPFNKYILTLSGEVIRKLYRECDYEYFSVAQSSVDVLRGGSVDIHTMEEGEEGVHADWEDEEKYSSTTSAMNNSYGSERSTLEAYMHVMSPECR